MFTLVGIKTYFPMSCFRINTGRYIVIDATVIGTDMDVDIERLPAVYMQY